MSKLVVGVDLGGTKISSVVSTDEGRIMGRDLRPTKAEAGPEVVIPRIVKSIEKAISKAGKSTSDIQSIGIGSAGIIDHRRGTIITAPNLPGWHNIELKGYIEQRFNLPTYMENDSTLGALGEHIFGAGRGIDHFIYISVGTGIGGGLIINGRSYAGALGVAGEIGHMTLDPSGPKCNCGNTGCWEALASGTAIVRRAREHIHQGAKTSILKLAEENVDNISARTIYLAAKSGDALALELISETGYWLGVGLANLVNILNPELIVIGGGLSKMGDLLLDPAIRTMKERAFEFPATSVRIALSQLEDDATTLGAVILAAFSS